MKIDKEKIEKAVKEILSAIGEDPSRDGLLQTPKRVAEMYEEIFLGLHEDAKTHLTIFKQEDHEEMVMVKEIPFYSICEHHLIPFSGKAHVVYIPKEGRVTGLSKLVKVVESYAKRPQVQEKLTGQIADTIMEALDPHGVLVIIEAEHLCMSMRGVKKPGTLTVTSAVRGVFRKDAKVRSEALALIRQ